jgi:hypothetical protein
MVPGPRGAPTARAAQRMPSKFTEFLEKNKIDPRRIVVASRALERLRPEDRSLRMLKRKARAAGAKPAEAAEGAEKQVPPKPRSGRPVTARLLEAVSAGKAVSGPAKTRLLRALNKVLEQKKKSTVDLRALF